MAAAAQGRDFLVSKDSGRVLIDSFITVLGVSAVGKNVKMRNLILMALYNTRLVSNVHCCSHFCNDILWASEIFAVFLVESQTSFS